MPEIKEDHKTEEYDPQRFTDSLNNLANGCNGCVNVGCIIPSIIIAIILFIGIFGSDLGL